MSLGPVTWPPSTIGMGDETHGYWVGTAGDGTSKLIVAPKSTETTAQWGSYGITRAATSITDGLTNTNLLYAFGNSITTGHPAAYYCKTLTFGGYNTWYLPAPTELMSTYSAKNKATFTTSNSAMMGTSTFYWGSFIYTDNPNYGAWGSYQDGSMSGAIFGTIKIKTFNGTVRAVRRTSI